MWDIPNWCSRRTSSSPDITSSTRSEAHWTPSRTSSSARSVGSTRDITGFQKRGVDFTPDITRSSPDMTGSWWMIIGLCRRAASGPKFLGGRRRSRSIVAPNSGSWTWPVALVDVGLRCTRKLPVVPLTQCRLPARAGRLQWLALEEPATGSWAVVTAILSRVSRMERHVRTFQQCVSF